MRQRLIDLLKALEAAIPPPLNCHHALTFARYGSDETEWADQLAAQINSAGVFHCFFLDEADFENGPDQVAAEIVALLAENNPSAQLGVGPGQYLPE